MSSKRSPRHHHLYSLVLALAVLGLLLASVQALAEKVKPYEGKIDDIRISVNRSSDKYEFMTLRPGAVLNLNPGQRVMMRLFCPKDKNPTGTRQYLSAEFTVEPAGHDHVDVVETDIEQGKITVQALRRGAGKKATLSYRLVGKVDASHDYLLSGTIPIEIAEAEEATAPTAPTPPTGPRPRRGVTLYEDSYFRGDSETFYEDWPELGGRQIGNDRVSSVRVPEGCTVTLYRDARYRGQSVVLHSDTAELGRTAVGNDSVSSLQVHCE